MLKLLPSLGLTLILLTPFSSFGECLGDKGAKNSYSVYVVPQLSPTHIYTHWSPLLEQLGKRSKQCFDLVVSPNIPVFEKQLLTGKADFAFVNPYHAVMAFRAHQYKPLVADGKNKLDGIVVVRADSNLSDLKALNNSKIAFPAPNAFAASLLIRALLTKDTISFEPIYVKSHENVYRSVIVGDVAAGGGVNNTFNREPPEIQAQLKVLYRTPKYMPHPFIANPRIPMSVQKAVQDSFIAMGADPALKEMLNDVQIPEPMAVDFKRDYMPLENLKLEKFVVISEN